MDATIRYVDVDGASVATQVLEGERGGDVDVVLLAANLTVPMSMWHRDRVMDRFVHGLADLGRLVLFDRRGIGISDGLHPDVSIRTQWADDLVAVVESVCRGPAVVVCTGFCEAAVLAAVARPELFRDLVLVSPFPTWSPELAEAVAVSEQLSQEAVRPGSDSGFDLLAFTMPTRADDDGFRQWFEDAGRLGASPAVARRLFEHVPDDEVEALAAAHRRLAVPTLVLHRPGAVTRLGRPVDMLEHVHALYPGATRVDVPGVDWLPLGDGLDAVLAEVQRHVLGEVRLPEPDRRLGAVLFTDVVDSTSHAARVGDVMWRTLIERHDELVGRTVEHENGRVVKSTGDGVLAVFASAHDAVVAAGRVLDEVAGLDLRLRAAIHVGDVVHHHDDLTGLAVVVAARLLDLADGGEVWVTDTVRAALLGQHVDAEDRGEHDLRGVPGTWRAWSVSRPTV